MENRTSDFLTSNKTKKFDIIDSENQKFIHCDVLISGREKKMRQEMLEDPIWDPFGSPGSGAPLKTQNNLLVTKLPNVTQNIWERFAPVKAPNPITNKENGYLSQSPSQEPSPALIEDKKREIHNIIDIFANNRSEKRDLVAGRRTTQKLYDNKKEENYWNDWFGRPGNGAPRWTFNKQNLDSMLEPKDPLFQPPRPRNFNSSIDTYASYNPTIGSISPRRPYRSDHHNRYELNPR